MTLENNKSELFYDPFVDRIDDFDNKFRKGRMSDKSSNTDEGRSSACSEHSDNGDDDHYQLAPPIDILDRIKGYEMVSFDSTSVPPPQPEVEPVNEESQKEGSEPPKDDADGNSNEPEQKPKKTVYIVQEIGTKLSEQQARAALLTHISSHCCYGSSAAKNMTISSMEYMAAYHYELQTFTEKRETAWTYAPFKSGFEAGGSYSYGSLAPPLPWEIEEDAIQPFKDEVRLIEVPHTESTKSCHRCRGTGGVACHDCNGKGWVRCLHCHGNGWMYDSGGHKERCFYCQHSRNGHGEQDCSKCQAKGKVNCQTCEGHGQLRCFIQLSITWKVHTADHIVERLDLPSDLIRDASGQVAFEEETSRVKPVDIDFAFSSSPEEGACRSVQIKEASSRLVNEHLSAFSLDQKVIRQRHQVRIVPVTRITYEWKGKPYLFFVYGYENKVHLPSYPQNCCWGCTII